MKRIWDKLLAVILTLAMLMPAAAFAEYGGFAGSGSGGNSIGGVSDKSGISGVNAVSNVSDVSNTTDITDTDIKGHWAEKPFADWVQKGLIHGYGDGSFKPNQAITRAEFVTLVNKVFNFSPMNEISFKDMHAEDAYYSEIKKAITAGYLSGYEDGTVRPGAVITRQEAAVVLAKVFALQPSGSSGTAVQLQDGEELPSWSAPAVAALLIGGYASGYPDHTFRGGNPVTRAEALVLLGKLSGEIFNQEGTHSGGSYRNAVIHRGGIVLKNATIQGNLYLTEGIAEGDVTLYNVKVQGKVYANGGGENTVILADSEIREIVVNKRNGQIRLAAKGHTSVQQIIVQSSAKLEEKALADGAEGFMQVILDEALPKHSKVQLSGEFAEVEVRSLSHPELSLLQGLIKKLVLRQQAALNVHEGSVIEEVFIHVNKTIPVRGKGVIHSNDTRLVREDEGASVPGNGSTNTPGGSSSSSPSTSRPSPNPNPQPNPQPGGKPTFTEVSVHDPSIIKDGGTYYVFGSHIEAAKSADLMNWTRFTNGYETPGNVIFGDLSANLAGSFAWAGENDSDSKGGFSVWAPDVVWNEHYVNEDGTTGAYMMYYSASSTYIRSAIGYAVSKNIEGPYQYVDTIVYSGFTRNDAYDADSQVNKKWTNTNLQALIDNGILAGSNPNWFNSNGSYNNSMYPNAIDATLFTDSSGRLWMTYGSWSGGIFVLELDPQTGRAMYPGQDGVTADGRIIDRYFGTKIAGGYTKSGEGPYIIYDKATGYYFLNVTYGWLGADGGYNMRLFRATEPDGPYVDAAGNNAVLPGNTDNSPYGIKMIGNFLFERQVGEPGTGIGYGYASPGHNSVYFEEETGKYFLLFHTRFPQRGEAHELRVHQMFLNKDGWLVVAPERYAGERIQTANAGDIAGDYKFVNHGLAYSGNITPAVNVRLNENKTITGDVTGSWELRNGHQAVITVDGVTYDGVFVRQWDTALERETMTFTAISSSGETVWGIRQPDKSDEQIVGDVKSALELGDTSRVMTHLTLPTTGARGTVISWQTSDETVITDKGIISPPEVGEANLTATLTATMTKGTATATKTFEIVVVPIDPAYGLVAQYSFEGDLRNTAGNFGAGTVTGNRIDNTGGTITYHEGVKGKAAVFDGNSGIKLPDGLIASDRYSVAMWLNVEQHTQFATSFFGAKANNSWISLVPQSWDNNTMLWSGESWYDATTGSRIRANEWHHVAFTVDRGTVKVFVDGVQKFSGTGFPNVFTDEHGTFGLGVNWWDTPFKGMMDEVRIYDVPITAELVAKLSQEYAPDPVENAAELTAQFSFEDQLLDTAGSFGAGTVIGDMISSPSGGTISYEPGVTGKAAVFDGASGVLLPEGLISGDSYSVTMWVYAEELAPYTPVFFGAQTSDSWISFQPKGHDGVGNSAMLWAGSNWYDAGTGVNTVPREWTHFAFTVNKGHVTVYVNGEEKFTGTGFPDVFLDDQGTFSLGVNWWDAPFKGMIDELHIYKGVITADEVAALAHK
ncbi:LamG-like jellyroll fold domain-containing protein [Paenibacillus woosongensis]|uniref:LamG-like jellyroll fold domain-containing protein n=1 Tax=Paenibacillus woosongensis TaxID=307580 RepID=UPI0018C1EB72|nr:LamG-like jellyroll fold domain-containing protein [Paenibacillus woosongensis]